MTLRATSALGHPALPVIAIAIMTAVVAVQMVKDVMGVMIIMKIAMVTVVVTGICLVGLGGMYKVLLKGHSKLYGRADLPSNIQQHTPKSNHSLFHVLLVRSLHYVSCTKVSHCIILTGRQNF